ncbi:F-box protein SKIP23-like [Tripterygium wilfordii]|uniref:F-box protein SKIP23-like n=1 Tax=Tripterygium wilfordii TaxID=458696 RepID=A0A7J7CZH5_TRIWF|nr:F-box protein SKIP23-like [Tripterygium wilfordii]
MPPSSLRLPSMEPSDSLISFTREGDVRLTLVHHQDELIFFYDVVYWKGNFYAVDSAGVLVVCDLEGPVPKLRKILTPQPPITGDIYYLVVSGDELLLVSRTIKSCFHNVNNINCRGHDIDENADHANSQSYNFIKDEDDDSGDEVDDNDYNNEDDDNGDGVDDNDYNNEDEDDGGVHLLKTIDFKFLSLMKWGGHGPSLENRMLFVGNNFSFSLCTNDFPQCKANHIYFTDDGTEGHMNYYIGASTVLTGGHDLGAYDMKNGKIEPFPCCPEVTWLIWPPPFWATLSLY